MVVVPENYVGVKFIELHNNITGKLLCSFVVTPLGELILKDKKDFIIKDRVFSLFVRNSSDNPKLEEDFMSWCAVADTTLRSPQLFFSRYLNRPYIPFCVFTDSKKRINSAEQYFIFHNGICEILTELEKNMLKYKEIYKENLLSSSFWGLGININGECLAPRKELENSQDLFNACRDDIILGNEGLLFYLFYNRKILDWRSWLKSHFYQSHKTYDIFDPAIPLYTCPLPKSMELLDEYSFYLITVSPMQNTIYSSKNHPLISKDDLLKKYCVDKGVFWHKWGTYSRLF